MILQYDVWYLSSKVMLKKRPFFVLNQCWVSIYLSKISSGSIGVLGILKQVEILQATPVGEKCIFLKWKEGHLVGYRAGDEILPSFIYRDYHKIYIGSGGW